MSLPSRERGLKFLKVSGITVLWVVAPFAGAWIEIEVIKWNEAEDGLSLPSRERGLKSGAGDVSWKGYQSLPSRERGLKFIVLLLRMLISHVAPFAGAWIEISWEEFNSSVLCKSLPSRERGLKFRRVSRKRLLQQSRSLRGSVD